MVTRICRCKKASISIDMKFYSHWQKSIQAVIQREFYYQSRKECIKSQISSVLLRWRKMIFSAISIYSLFVSQGAAFTSFKLSLLTLASTQRDFDFLIYFSLLPFACLYANFYALKNEFEYSFTLILSIVISCISSRYILERKTNLWIYTRCRCSMCNQWSHKWNLCKH